VSRSFLNEYKIVDISTNLTHGSHKCISMKISAVTLSISIMKRRGLAASSTAKKIFISSAGRGCNAPAG
jgi:hypothetical protein